MLSFMYEIYYTFKKRKFDDSSTSLLLQKVRKKCVWSNVALVTEDEGLVVILWHIRRS